MSFSQMVPRQPRLLVRHEPGPGGQSEASVNKWARKVARLPATKEKSFFLIFLLGKSTHFIAPVMADF